MLHRNYVLVNTEGLSNIKECTRELTKITTRMCWRGLDSPTKSRGCYTNHDKIGYPVKFELIYWGEGD